MNNNHSAAATSAAWVKAADKLKAEDPARYLACALAIRNGEDWKTMLKRLDFKDEAAPMGVRIRENQELTAQIRDQRARLIDG